MTRKAVRLIPDKRGRLLLWILSFIFKHAGTDFLCESFQYFCFYLAKKAVSLMLLNKYSNMSIYFILIFNFRERIFS